MCPDIMTWLHPIKSSAHKELDLSLSLYIMSYENLYDSFVKMFSFIISKL